MAIVPPIDEAKMIFGSAPQLTSWSARLSPSPSNVFNFNFSFSNTTAKNVLHLISESSQPTFWISTEQLRCFA